MTLKKRNIQLIILIVINLLILPLFWWSRNGSLTQVKVVLQDTFYTFSIDDHIITTTQVKGWDRGGIGYYQYRKAVPVIPLDQTLEEITVTRNDTGNVLFSEKFDDGSLDEQFWNYVDDTFTFTDSGLSSGSLQGHLWSYTQPWKNVTITWTIRNLLASKLFFRVRDVANYDALFMRPFRDFDSRFYVMKNNRKTSQTHNRTTYLNPWETAKRTVNLVLHTYPWFVLAFAGFCLLLYGLTRVLMLIMKNWFWLKNIVARMHEKSTLDKAQRLLMPMIIMFLIGVFFWLAHVTEIYLDSIPHVQDSAVYLFQAKIFAAGKLSADIPRGVDPRHFMLPGHVTAKDGKLFGNVTFGYPLFLTFGVFLGIEKYMPALAGSLLILFTWLLARRFIGPGWAFLAPILLFCSPFYQMTAPNFMGHTVAALYFAVCLYCFTGIERERYGLVSALVSGIFMGLLLNTRPMTAAAIAVGLGLFMIVRFFSSSRKLSLLGRYVIFVAVTASFLGLFFQFNRFLTGDYTNFTYGATAQKVFNNSFEYKRISKALLDNFTLSSLFLMVVLGWNAFLTTFFLFGTLVPEKKSKRYAYLILLLVVLMFAAYMLYSISSATVMYGPRYVFEATFLYIILVCWGGSTIISGARRILAFRICRDKKSDQLGKRSLDLASSILSISVFLLILVLGISSFLTWIDKKAIPWPGNAYVPQRITDLKGFNHVKPTIRNLVEKHNVSNALVLVTADPDRGAQWWHFGSVMADNNPSYDGSVVYAKDLGEARNRGLLEHYNDRDVYKVHYEKKKLWKYGEKMEGNPHE